MISQVKGGWDDLMRSAQRSNANMNKDVGAKAKLKMNMKKITQLTKCADTQAKGLLEKHWLEATDAKHRYGNALVLYFQVWNQSETEENFWYWLDEGQGKEVDLTEFPRQKMNETCVKYLDSEQRKVYEVEVKDGIFYYKQSGEKIDTKIEIKDNDDKGKFIFVVSGQKTMFCGPKIRGHFHHSSFLAGGQVVGAGNLEINDGILQNIKPHSGHYMPNAVEFKFLLDLFEKDWNIDMKNVAIGQMKTPKVKKHPNLQSNSYKKLIDCLQQQHSVQEADAQCQKMVRILLGRNSTQSNGVPRQESARLVTEEDEHSDFEIPSDFLEQDSIPVFLKRAFNENGSQYYERVNNFLLILSRQELVYIVSRIDPSRRDMTQLTHMIQSVLKEKVKQN